MKVNRITFDRIKAQYEILKMRAAYIAAEKLIIEEQVKGNDITGVYTTASFDPMTPEEFHKVATDGFGNIRNITPKELIKQKMNALEEQGRKLLEQEKYELFAELKEIYDKYKQEYDRL